MAINFNPVHVGNAIAAKLREKEITQRKFAEMIGVAQPEVTRLLKRNSVDTGKLLAYSIVLDYNFFEDFCPDLKGNKEEQTIHRDTEGNGETIKELVLQMSYLRSENEKKNNEIELKNKEIERLMAVIDTLTSIKNKVTSDGKKTASL